MDNEIRIKVFRPFGPAIAEIDIPNQLVKKLNEFTDDCVSNEKKRKKLDASDHLIGQVHQEFHVAKEFYEKHLKKFLTNVVESYVKNINGKQIKSFKVLNCWIVRQFKNEYNPNHYHNGHISGVGYLTVPKDMGGHKNEKKKKSNGKIELIHGSRTFLSPAQYQITPTVGKLYLFPHYLMHTVYPFNTDGERRSFSFNSEVDEDIYRATYAGSAAK